METFNAGSYDIAVIGAGHAGIEAALAAARLGLETIVFTINLDSVGNMPCNPAIGGTAKGHLVRELDALGGEMAKAADECCIQYRLLNKGKGPAVWSLRAQADRRKYQGRMKHALERQEHLTVRQGEAVELRQENGAVSAVVLSTGAVFHVRAVILATGTYLSGRTITGECIEDSGPDGMHAAGRLAESLRTLGLPLRRFKTGTPPRVLAQTVDFDEMEVQTGDELPIPFSYSTKDPPENRAVCWLTWTTEETRRIVRENLDRAPMYSGTIQGVGPRYCPSFETKIVRFPEKLRHQLFVEPMGLDTEELYIQGFSSSMPEEVQIQMLHSVPGLQRAVMSRPAYAIEYDCLDPLALAPTLEVKALPGLYGAGQFNGSSGYEEAAVQGFVAGVNAARKLRGEGPFILSRAESYAGTLIDDLVTKGTEEPYRMMTSRSEYRLLLRQDNADLRLTRRGCEIGLVPEERLRAVEAKYAAVDREIQRLRHSGASPSPELAAFLASKDTADAPGGCPLDALLRRPRIHYDELAPFDPERPDLPPDVREQVEISVKYEGYIRRQEKQVEDFRKMSSHQLPDGIDYSGIQGLRLEAREKLNAVKPLDLGQASRISGVSPADVAALMIALESGSLKPFSGRNP
ncbi:MAG: tRNA uridine-5-carboxymethylaminomethyl(34) synthesis enzyme MnmG [Oscillibacter sp.]|nr:tRNA uridine-5-carboxymethylaminomethyl(34) synthesis enzyme MnmG [Oscillibacter sp.]